jgi:hypothetical protein
MGEKRNAYRILVGKARRKETTKKPEGKKPLRRPCRRWVDNIVVYRLAAIR